MNAFLTTAPVLLALASLGTAAGASAHLHVNTTAASPDPGTPLAIGFYGSDTFSIADTGSRLEFQQDGSLFTLTTDAAVGTEYDALVPGLAGMQRADMPNFTLDGGTPGAQNLAAPGRDLSAPLGYELFSVTDAATGEALRAGERVLWRFFGGHGGALALPADVGGNATFAADSAGETTLERSYLLAVGTHAHGSRSVPGSGFFLFTDAAPGAYDVALRAVDPVADFFTASDPVTLRLNVVPEPASGPLAAAAGALLPRRRRWSDAAAEMAPPRQPGPQTTTSRSSCTPKRSATWRAASSITASTSAARPPASTVTKFAWRRLTSAEPIRRPLPPAASISLPAAQVAGSAGSPALAEAPEGFLNAQPALLAANGCSAFFAASRSRTRARTAAGSSGLSSKRAESTVSAESMSLAR